MIEKDERLEKCFSLIEHISEDTIIRLYDAIEDYLYQSIHYEKVISNIPFWVAEAGCTPEVPISKEMYEQNKQAASHPIFKKIIYHYDIWNILSAIQDRLVSVRFFLNKFYSDISSVAHATEEQYTGSSRNNGIHVTDTHTALNSIFISVASAFDLLSKVAYEQFHQLEYGDFSNYNKMLCRNTIFNVSGVDVNPKLKASGLLFSPSKDVATIVSFRNEYVHNGPWDRNCTIYTTFINDEPSDSIIYSPDIDNDGRFVSSGARNKFYSQKNRINFMLPDILLSVFDSFNQTIEELIKLYESETDSKPDDKLTDECLSAISAYYMGLFPDKTNSSEGKS